MMSEFKFVPARMLLDKETIGAIKFHCGDGADGQFGEYSDGLLWVGIVTDDDGKEVYGLHLATAEYPEEGSTTLVEFAAPVPPVGVEPEVLGYSVKGNRYAIKLTKGELLELYEGYTGDALIELVDRAHLTRLTAERDALQLRLNAADQRIDELGCGGSAEFSAGRPSSADIGSV